MTWTPTDFCKDGYYGLDNQNIPVCGRDNYQTPCKKEQCELYNVKHKGLTKFFKENRKRKQ